MSELLDNRYRILQVIGEGAFGKTFLAEDTRTPLNRRCVVKQLKPATNEPVKYQILKERFQREAVMLETLGKTNEQIPNLHAYFTEHQEFYLVQDWIEGENLAQKVKAEGILSESVVCQLLSSLLLVFEFIHAKGIIHRDVKPENIMLRARDGKPVLIDFGAVKEVISSIVDSQGGPDSSIIIGTPGYMALEQAAGQPVFSSDLYSLGMTAIFLLTGKRPKELQDPLTGEVKWHQLAIVSAELRGILDKAIQRFAHDRYQTAGDMNAALRSLVSTIHNPIPTPPIPDPPVPVPVLRQKLIFAIIGILILVIGTIGALFTFSGAFSKSGPPIKSSCYLFNDDPTQKTVNVRSKCDKKSCDTDASTILGEYPNYTAVRVNREVTVKSIKGFNWMQIVIVDTNETAWVAASKIRCP